MDELTTKLAKISDPETRARILANLNIDDAMQDVLLHLVKLKEDAAKTGADVTADQAKHFSDMGEAWRGFGLTLEGIQNKIADQWSGTVTEMLKSSSDWIQRNEKTAETIEKIAAGVGALAAIKPALWVLRLLGLAAPLEMGAAIGGPAAAGVIAGDYLNRAEASRSQAISG